MLIKAKDSITDKTKAILLVNLLGNPNDINTIKNILRGKILLYWRIIVNLWVRVLKALKQVILD